MLGIEAREAGEQMLYTFKTAVVSANPVDNAPLMFPDWFKPDEAGPDPILDDSPVEFDFSDTDIIMTPDEVDRIMEQFQHR